LADTQIVGGPGDRQAPPQRAANGRRNGAANGRSNGAVNGHVNGAVNGHVNGAANGHANGAANGHPDRAAELEAELADWIYWNVSPYWDQFLNGDGSSNGHGNGTASSNGSPPATSNGSPPARKDMPLAGVTPTGLARRLGR
jgi:hypothetical protein